MNVIIITRHHNLMVTVETCQGRTQTMKNHVVKQGSCLKTDNIKYLGRQLSITVQKW